MVKAKSERRGWCMFATKMFGSQIMFGTNHQIFLMYCAGHKLWKSHAKHNFGAEHIVPKLNGAKVRIPHFDCYKNCDQKTLTQLLMFAFTLKRVYLKSTFINFCKYY